MLYFYGQFIYHLLYIFLFYFCYLMKKNKKKIENSLLKSKTLSLFIQPNVGS